MCAALARGLRVSRKAQAILARGGASVWGTVTGSDGASLRVAGLSGLARLGDRLEVASSGETGARIMAEVVAFDGPCAIAMLMGPAAGLAAGARADLLPTCDPRPCQGWLGAVVDGNGTTPDGRLLPAGTEPAPLHRHPPEPAARRGLGARLKTGLAATDTVLPICRGQRIGIFAGSGIGKSTLLGALARGIEADVAVIGLIGERGREVSAFVRDCLGETAMARSVVVAATSDRPATVKRRAAWLAMATAEHFRDRGHHVLCVIDSLTRFAEAHREVALAAGETPALRAFPPSTAAALSALCERAGPGSDDQGDITAIFGVLVAGSDMEEPVADMVRGTLDGHIVLDRTIAERGRFPAIDLRRSVSRSAPGAWSPSEQELASRARAIVSDYEEALPMIRAGLYEPGTDPALDSAVARWSAIDAFLGSEAQGQEAFARLDEILGSPRHASRQTRRLSKETRRE